MESDAGAPSSRDARDASALVDRGDADLADRLITPWWYHPGLGLGEALLVTSVAMPPLWETLAVLAAAVLLGLVTSAWTRLTGLSAWSPGYTVLAWPWVAALAGVVLVALAVVELVDRLPVTLAAAALALGATVVLGRCGDAALRRRLRAGARR